MLGRVKRAILTGGMLICFIGVLYSYQVGYDLGVYLNAGILIILLIRWIFMFKEERE